MHRLSTGRLGQILSLLLVAVVVTTLLFACLFERGVKLWDQVRTQRGVDLVILSGCSYLASSVNQLGELNRQISKTRRRMKQIIAAWHSLAVCAASCMVGLATFCSCLPLYRATSRVAPRLLRLLSARGRLSELRQDSIRFRLPVRVRVEMRSLAHKNGVATLSVRGVEALPLRRAARESAIHPASPLRLHPVFREIRLPSLLYESSDLSRQLSISGLRAGRPQQLEEAVVARCGIEGGPFSGGAYSEVLYE